MMRPFELAKLDQDKAFVAEYYASLWAAMFRNMVDAGMTAEQAMDALRVYIVATTTPLDPPKEEK